MNGIGNGNKRGTLIPLMESTRWAKQFGAWEQAVSAEVGVDASVATPS